MTDPSWQRLDPRMLLVHPIREVLRFLPALIALAVAGRASGGLGEWWQLAAVVVPVGLGVLRYLTTAYRITPGRIELRRGLLSRHVLSAPLDRVRTVDITAPPIHRLLGLASVRIGTGTASTEDDEQLDLDGLPAARARELRARLLHAGDGGAAVTDHHAVLELDPAWVRFAPLTSTGLVVAAGALGLALQLADLAGGVSIDTRSLADGAQGWSPWLVGGAGAVVLLAVVALLSVGGYLVTNWGFRLSHADRTWHVRRGLFTTRETALDDERVRGVSVGEPLGLRVARGARATAIATGHGAGQSTLLVPPAPRAVVRGAAGAVLGAPAALTRPLTGHGPRARTRRFTRAGLPAALVVLAAVLAVPAGAAPWLPAAVAVIALPGALLLAADRSRALGHALTDRHLVVRSGSLNRRHEALELDGVIGWNLRATWPQRRVGLTTLVATTAGGHQAVTALDVPEPTAVELAHAAHPDLIAQFLSRQ